MNSEGGYHQKAGAVELGGSSQAALAKFTVGEIGFGPHWSAEDSMAASIIRLEQENQELRAEVALAEAERIEMAKMLRSEREAHAKCQNQRDGCVSHLNQVCEEIGMGDGYIAVDAAIMAAAKINRLETQRPEPSPHSCKSCGVAWAEHLGISGTCKALQDALQTIESLRDQLCADKCRDKAAADRGWANI